LQSHFAAGDEVAGEGQYLCIALGGGRLSRRYAQQPRFEMVGQLDNVGHFTDATL
jgi:hypothetical protein